MKLVLASQSPRRRELLERAGFSITVSPSQISEILDENLNLTARIEDLARRKAEAWVEAHKGSNLEGILALSADTVVALGDQILGKPNDEGENLSYLRQLSGRVHQVITAVCLVEPTRRDFVVGHAAAQIKFRSLSEIEMTQYVASRDGLDKAGGYGIQGAAGKFVENLDGAFDTVMGLPISLVEQLLHSKNWLVERIERTS